MATSSVFPVTTSAVIPFPQSGEVLRAVMENAPIGMSLLDGDGRVAEHGGKVARLLLEGHGLSLKGRTDDRPWVSSFAEAFGQDASQKRR